MKRRIRILDLFIGIILVIVGVDLVPDLPGEFVRMTFLILLAILWSTIVIGTLLDMLDENKEEVKNETKSKRKIKIK